MQLSATPSPGGPEASIRLSDGYVYWINNGALRRAPVGGGPESTVLSFTAPSPSDFIVDAGFVYFSIQDSGDIFKAPAAGGATVKIGNGLALSYNILAVDNASLYWIDQMHVGRIALDGSTGTKYIVFGGMDSAFFTPSLAVDDRYIYWTETGSGQIRRTVKTRSVFN